jgi:hypothetical protein
MGFTDLLDEVTDRKKRLTVYSPSPQDITEYFEAWNVDVKYRSLPEGSPDGFITVHDDGRFLGSVSLEAATNFVNPADYEPWESERRSATYRDLLDLLDDTLFTANDRRQMLATSREFEDRAWRLGRGTLYAGFETPSTFRTQQAVYERLASKGGLAVELYVHDDAELPDVDGATLHPTHSEELAATWFVIYDGGGEELQKCTLVGTQKRENEFTGFWTYDPELVDRVISTVRSLSS